MKIIDKSTAETVYADENGAESLVRIQYHYQPAEPEQPDPDHPGFGPSRPAEVIINVVEQYGPDYDPHIWLEFEDYSEEEAEAWAVEILEIISTEGAQ